MQNKRFPKVLTREQILEKLDQFEYNKYKQHIIKDKIPDGTSTTIYRNGPFIDLCRGPHIPHTGRIKTFKVMKNSASYFLGDAANDSLQRIYGISFPDKNLMAEHLHYLEEAAKRVSSRHRSRTGLSLIIRRTTERSVSNKIYSSFTISHPAAASGCQKA